jgi:hypothetical protein
LIPFKPAVVFNKLTEFSVLDGATAKEELFKKQAKEQEKTWRKSNGNRIVQKYSTIYASDACWKTIACNEAEEAAIAKIACKKGKAYNKKVLVWTRIVHRQAAKWGVKWVTNIQRRRRQFMVMWEREFKPALERRNARRALEIKYCMNLYLNGYVEEEPVVL